MTQNSVNAASNPTLANQLLTQAVAAPENNPEPAVVISPSNGLVNLPGGYVTDSREVIRTAEVRELNGADEEAIAKIIGNGRVFNTILKRGTVSVGPETATDEILDGLFSGDRETLLLGIYKATFGPTAEVPSYCTGCQDTKIVEVSIDDDIQIKRLSDPITESTFIVKGKKEYLVSLPKGSVHRKILENADDSIPELTTILLEGCVLQIDGAPVYSKAQILNIGVQDRRLINNEIASRNIGPQFESATVQCPDCGREVVVPISLGTLFRF